MQVSQKIVDYAIRYYLRYYPSTQKLRVKLNEKFGPNSEKGKKFGGIDTYKIDYIVQERLKNIIEEDAVLRAKIKLYQLRNKNVNYIKNSLRQKMFDPGHIQRILIEEILQPGESILNPDKLYRQIQLYHKKGKSKMYIRQRFIERSEDRDLVEGFINEIYKNGEIDAIIYEYKKIETKYEKHKIIEKLMRKGFKYEDIMRVIDA